MASSAPPPVPMDSAEPVGAALQHGHWRKLADLASGLARLEQFLERAGFDRAPWLVVAFAGGIAAWFALPTAAMWLVFIHAMLATCAFGLAALKEDGRFPYIRQAVTALTLAAALGCALVWAKSELVGVTAIERPMVGTLNARVLERIDQPADHRVRLLLATREPGTGRAIRVRVNLDSDSDLIGLAEGAEVRLRARLMPPAPPMLPGGYDFARAAWFGGIAATGSVLGPVTLVRPAADGMGLGRAQRVLSQHVRAHLDGSPGALAAAFASGDRGAIAPADEDAMRNAGLTHLLSISGLHVSAVIAAVYFLSLRLFALWPWLVLRVRVPILAAGTGALAGIGYTLLTGAEVLEKTEWPGKFIPLIPVYGDEVNVEGKRHLFSLVHFGTDSQREYNYHRSAATEMVALAPKAPFIGEEGAFDADPEKWATANSTSHAYIEHKKGSAAPQRQPFTGVPVGEMQLALSA